MERPKAQKGAARLQQTPICCSFRGMPRVHRRWASRFPRSRTYADWSTLGGARKLQQIAVRLRGDVRAVTKRRLRGCGATFARLRNDVCAATNRSLFAERRLRGCGATFARQQIAACSILPMFAPPAWRSFPDKIAHPIGACGVISRKQTRAMRCGRGNPLSGRIAGARTHPRACPAPRLRRRP